MLNYCQNKRNSYLNWRELCVIQEQKSFFSDVAMAIKKRSGDMRYNYA